MNGGSNKIQDKSNNACQFLLPKVDSMTIEQNNPRELKVTKVIYNYKAKTEKQIKESIQLEIDAFLKDWPSYKFVNSKSYFNKTDGLEMVLFFVLK
jgi:hypothetical protein